MNILSQCYCTYEIPYRGVSMINPSGHLSMALRNVGENQTFGDNLNSIFKQGSFQIIENQLNLNGVLGMSDWELIFVPCVNRDYVDENDLVQTRHLLLRTLSRTEPNILRKWISGMPGSVLLAKIDYILLEDKHSHLFKYNPITALWVPTSDGLKSKQFSNPPFPSSSRKFKHFIKRLILFTTDFEVYSFQFCYPREDLLMLASPLFDHSIVNVEKFKLSNKGLLKKNLGHFIKNFIFQLCSRISFVRQSPAYILAEDYIVKIKTNMTYDHVLESAPSNKFKSIDIFNRANLTMNCSNENYEPINLNPVMPIERLNDLWFESIDDCKFVNNLNFSFCRTYPLVVPSVPFHSSLDSFRKKFDGFRFPVVSFCYLSDRATKKTTPPKHNLTNSPVFATNTKMTTNRLVKVHRSCRNIQLPTVANSVVGSNQSPNMKIWIMRSGQIAQHSDATLDELFGYDANSNDSCARFIHIALQYSSADVLSTKFHVTSNDQHALSMSATDILDGLLPPSCSSVKSNYTWSIPTLAQIDKSWSKLKNLLHLSQIHIPKIKLSLPDSVVADDSLGSIRTDKIGHVTTSSSDDEMDDLCSIDEAVGVDYLIKKSQLGRKASSASVVTKASSKLRTNRSKWDRFVNVFRRRSSLSNNSLAMSYYNSFLTHNQHKLKLVASQRNFHRSVWFAHFLNTKWLDLVQFAINQAMNLVYLIGDADAGSIFKRCETYLLISGPDSGRIWQPILLSLTQVILLPERRTLEGFENLIEREWVRLGYPFTPDPTDWSDDPITEEYEHGVIFTLFLDCVHQLLIEYPTDFEFTQDYLVLLMDCALSRGGGLPPFAIEFCGSCEAARSISDKGKTSKQLLNKSKLFEKKGVWRSFRNWPNVLTPAGLELLPNWLYWWKFSKNPLEYPSKSRCTITSNAASELDSSAVLHPFGYYSFKQIAHFHYPHIWTYVLLRWNRSTRQTNGGGYAFDSAYYRKTLKPKPVKYDDSYHVVNSEANEDVTLEPRTSSSPYTGWLSDEAVWNALNTDDKSFSDCAAVVECNIIYEHLFKVADFWDYHVDN